MAKAFHGRVEDTRDALIIFEACRQGLLPRLNRRLLATERGEGHPDHDLLVSTSASTSIALVKHVNPTQSLITPGSVFVFDETETGICRWTDGRIWSPSRISGNFLVYRELYRKLPDQKCLTPRQKEQMKNGDGIMDKALKKKVREDGLVVLGCVKGTFVLKKDGLIKKTMCVRGVDLLSPEEMLKMGDRANRGRANKRGSPPRPPGFSLAGVQHLVCYERERDMNGLHRPREYVQLRDLLLSKTFIKLQKFRNPVRVLPLVENGRPYEPMDEYVSGSRVTENRQTTISARTSGTDPRPSSEDRSTDTSDEDESSGERSLSHSSPLSRNQGRQRQQSSLQNSDQGLANLALQKNRPKQRRNFRTTASDHTRGAQGGDLKRPRRSKKVQHQNITVEHGTTAMALALHASMSDPSTLKVEDNLLVVRGFKTHSGKWCLFPPKDISAIPSSAGRTGHNRSHGLGQEMDYHNSHLWRDNVHGPYTSTAIQDAQGHAAQAPSDVYSYQHQDIHPAGTSSSVRLQCNGGHGAYYQSDIDASSGYHQDFSTDAKDQYQTDISEVASLTNSQESGAGLQSALLDPILRGRATEDIKVGQPFHIVNQLAKDFSISPQSSPFGGTRESSLDSLSSSLSLTEDPEYAVPFAMPQPESQSSSAAYQEELSGDTSDMICPVTNDPSTDASMDFTETPVLGQIPQPSSIDAAASAIPRNLITDHDMTHQTSVVSHASITIPDRVLAFPSQPSLTSPCPSDLPDSFSLTKAAVVLAALPLATSPTHGHVAPPDFLSIRPQFTIPGDLGQMMSVISNPDAVIDPVIKPPAAQGSCSPEALNCVSSMVHQEGQRLHGKQLQLMQGYSVQAQPGHQAIQPIRGEGLLTLMHDHDGMFYSSDQLQYAQGYPKGLPQQVLQGERTHDQQDYSILGQETHQSFSADAHTASDFYESTRPTDGRFHFHGNVQSNQFTRPIFSETSTSMGIAGSQECDSASQFRLEGIPRVDRVRQTIADLQVILAEDDGQDNNSVRNQNDASKIKVNSGNNTGLNGDFSPHQRTDECASIPLSVRARQDMDYIEPLTNTFSGITRAPMNQQDTTSTPWQPPQVPTLGSYTAASFSATPGVFTTTTCASFVTPAPYQRNHTQRPQYVTPSNYLFNDPSASQRSNSASSVLLQQEIGKPGDFGWCKSGSASSRLVGVVEMESSLTSESDSAKLQALADAAYQDASGVTATGNHAANFHPLEGTFVDNSQSEAHVQDLEKQLLKDPSCNGDIVPGAQDADNTSGFGAESGFGSGPTLRVPSTSIGATVDVDIEAITSENLYNTAPTEMEAPRQWNLESNSRLNGYYTCACGDPGCETVTAAMAASHGGYPPNYNYSYGRSYDYGYGDDSSDMSSLGQTEYLLHRQHSQLSQVSQQQRQQQRHGQSYGDGGPPSSFSDRFSDDKQPWSLVQQMKSEQDIFPMLPGIRSRPRSRSMLKLSEEGGMEEDREEEDGEEGTMDTQLYSDLPERYEFVDEPKREDMVVQQEQEQQEPYPEEGEEAEGKDMADELYDMCEVKAEEAEGTEPRSEESLILSLSSN
ncbi:hypothetical protein BG011_009275 [Mortierella polycephala]|uniref:Uncharacterized protein n=1 Tax=Mortierella polycephala TaxID=41804 RepID=A0A9P6PLK4_9FUNG|nr:hypothetical protein BG011_009275 [Mortierella polycephala]